MISRRAILASLFVGAAAPAIVRAASLMKGSPQNPRLPWPWMENMPEPIWYDRWKKVVIADNEYQVFKRYGDMWLPDGPPKPFQFQTTLFA